MHQDSNTPIGNSIPQGMKRCTKCARTLSVAMFHRDRNTGDGLKPQCVECRAEHKRRYREANKEKLAKQERRYREDNKGKVADSQRRYYEANRCKLSEWHRRYREENECKLAEWRRRYRRENPDISRAHHRNRRALKIANGGRVSASEWQSVLARFDGQCAKCGANEDIHMDHVVPLSKGGSHSVDNIQPLCATCNMRKHTKVEDYRGKMYQPLALPLDNDT